MVSAMYQPDVQHIQLYLGRNTFTLVGEGSFSFLKALLVVVIAGINCVRSSLAWLISASWYHPLPLHGFLWTTQRKKVL